MAQLAALGAAIRLPSPTARPAHVDGEAFARQYINTLRAASGLPPLQHAAVVLSNGRWRVFEHIWLNGGDIAKLIAAGHSREDDAITSTQDNRKAEYATLRVYIRHAATDKVSAEQLSQYAASHRLHGLPHTTGIEGVAYAGITLGDDVQKRLEEDREKAASGSQSKVLDFIREVSGRDRYPSFSPSHRVCAPVLPLPHALLACTRVLVLFDTFHVLVHFLSFS